MAHPSFQQVMIRVKDRDSAVAFFEKNFGMTVIDRKDAPAHRFDLTFMASLSEAEIASLPEPGTPEANKYLWTFPRTVLELTHNYGTESDPDQKYENGNSDPHRGFGHVGFIVDDLPAFCDKLEANGAWEDWVLEDTTPTARPAFLGCVLSGSILLTPLPIRCLHLPALQA
jgi:lactoylglutathione lyase